MTYTSTKRKDIIQKYLLFRKTQKFRSIYNIYKKPSIYKETAYHNCVYEWYTHLPKNIELTKHQYTILTHNSMMFTFAFIGISPENNHKTFYYITPENAYSLDLETEI